MSVSRLRSRIEAISNVGNRIADANSCAPTNIARIAPTSVRDRTDERKCDRTYGKIFPGFRIPFGSNAAFTRFISAIASGDSSMPT